MNRPVPVAFIVAAVVLFGAYPAAGQIYQYRDSRGNVVFTDKPPADANAEETKMKSDSVFWAAPRNDPDPEPAPNRPSPAGQSQEPKRQKDYRSVTVLLYMTSWGGYCKQAAAYVQSLGAGLVQYDIEKMPEKRKEMTQKGGGPGVPFIDIEGTYIRGYSQGSIKAALDRAAR